MHAVAPEDPTALERTVQSLCIGLRRRNHMVHVAAVSDTPAMIERFQAPLINAGVQLHPVVLPRHAYLREKRALDRLVAEIRPDVLHTHGFRSDILAALPARETGVPTVTTVHRFNVGGWRNCVHQLLRSVALVRCDAVVAVSRSLADAVSRSGVVAERLRVIPNAWLEAEAPLGRAAARRALGLTPDDHKVVGWVGRLSRESGPDLALQALALLADLPVMLVLLGDGPARGECERLAARLGVADRVHWSGAVPDSGRLFGAFDAFLQSARTEGPPIALFEAMASRTPIVATAVSGVDDVLSGGTALVVPTENAEALAQAIHDVFRYPRHATARATAARTRLLIQYEPQRWVDAYETLYHQVSHPRS